MVSLSYSEFVGGQADGLQSGSSPTLSDAEVEISDGAIDDVVLRAIWIRINPPDETVLRRVHCARNAHLAAGQDEVQPLRGLGDLRAPCASGSA